MGDDATSPACAPAIGGQALIPHNPIGGRISRYNLFKREGITHAGGGVPPGFGAAHAGRGVPPGFGAAHATGGAPSYAPQKGPRMIHGGAPPSYGAAYVAGGASLRGGFGAAYAAGGRSLERGLWGGGAPPLPEKMKWVKKYLIFYI